MSKHWWWLLAGGLAACNKQVEIAPGVSVKHEHDVAFQQQVNLLQAEQVKVSAVTQTGPAGPSLLTLELINPHSAPAQHPDTLKQRLRKLAHLLVADLASPTSYQAISVQATFKSSLHSPGTSSSAQAFIYQTANLR